MIHGKRVLVLGLAFTMAGRLVAAVGDDQFVERRARMVETIEAYARSVGRGLGKPALDPKVREVMRAVPRHEFVPERVRASAYADRPLPIGHGQTISQPFIVALMTDLLDIEADDVVLEVGTGSGYQAAVLARLARQVYTIEIIPALARTAAESLRRVGAANVQTRIGDGYYGWEEHGPFDEIVVTAAASHVPPPLIEQLKPDARMVIPVGGAFTKQQLMLVHKHADGRVTTRQLLPVAFVPLIRKPP